MYFDQFRRYFLPIDDMTDYLRPNIVTFAIILHSIHASGQDDPKCTFEEVFKSRWSVSYNYQTPTKKRMWLYALHDHSIHGHVMFVLSNRNGLSIVHYIHISHQFAILLHIQHVKKEIMQFNKKSAKKLRYISLTVHHRPKLEFNDVFVRWFSVRNCK